MAYYIIFYAYYCKKCKKNLYIANAKFPSKRTPECPKCGSRTSFMGKVKVLLNDFEEYRKIVEQRIYEELPVEGGGDRESFLTSCCASSLGSRVLRSLRSW